MLLIGKMAFLPEMILSLHRRALDGAGPLSCSLSSGVASFNRGLTSVPMAVSSATSASTVIIPFSGKTLSSVRQWMSRCIFLYSWCRCFPISTAIIAEHWLNLSLWYRCNDLEILTRTATAVACTDLAAGTLLTTKIALISCDGLREP